MAEWLHCQVNHVGQLVTRRETPRPFIHVPLTSSDIGVLVRIGGSRGGSEPVRMDAASCERIIGSRRASVWLRWPYRNIMLARREQRNNERPAGRGRAQGPRGMWLLAVCWMRLTVREVLLSNHQMPCLWPGLWLHPGTGFWYKRSVFHTAGIIFIWVLV